jgi:hypothetical protein
MLVAVHRKGGVMRKVIAFIFVLSAHQALAEECIKPVPDLWAAQILIQDPRTAAQGQAAIEQAKAIERHNASCNGGGVQGYDREEELQLLREQVAIQRAQLQKQQVPAMTTCIPIAGGGVACQKMN